MAATFSRAGGLTNRTTGLRSDFVNLLSYRGIKTQHGGIAAGSLHGTNGASTMGPFTGGKKYLR